jgi:hypothetical protein
MCLVESTLSPQRVCTAARMPDFPMFVGLGEIAYNLCTMPLLSFSLSRALALSLSLPLALARSLTLSLHLLGCPSCRSDLCSSHPFPLSLSAARLSQPIRWRAISMPTFRRTTSTSRLRSSLARLCAAVVGLRQGIREGAARDGGGSGDGTGNGVSSISTSSTAQDKASVAAVTEDETVR